MAAEARNWLSILVLAGVTGTFAWTTWKYRLLRDASSVNPQALPAYSLSRSQLLFWTFNVLCAFLLVVIHQGYPQPPTGQVIPNQALILMGISIGTSLGSSMLDSANDRGADSTGSYWKDILSGDGQKVDLHRFQLVIWTLVGGAVFWVGLVRSGFTLIPAFDPGLLTLMGISGTAYLGLKVNE